ncbi:MULTISPECIES: LysM peptidoglycan-binding domain-containing protein [Actinotignum]|uniref:LysM peptidoglycan-binding domain-containing protein n=2 Tax=Actinotignum timonense TaxID=1870995 RepID=A0AAW9HAV1_9ACTO|nr:MULTISPECIES: LysM peptidoglycan-binding domain-containing protein [Actinotignum]MBS5748599.1 LysM peptidoglycan-binding domain-containing protein [Actinotignum schaalii]MDE1557711.1 LysM peptidoglycan-binding domain-containing protein [Actinotignum schaalii]MDE1662920.1 LysM peptidoglycan-binding domain-containing protein [Actinotignum schaalii]MDK6372676.1 LysM peptidoglycan-binding domain-containing protein [Actinotignum timonense]MDK6418292.1 LysM peptidoglycan-binding domain-containing
MSVAYQEIPRETSRAHTSRRHPKLRVVGEHPAARQELRGEEMRCGEDRGDARPGVLGDARGGASVTALRVVQARRRWNTPALGAVRRPVAFAPQSIARSATQRAEPAAVRSRTAPASLDVIVRMGVRVALTIAVTLLLASFAMIVGTTFLETGMATVTVQGGDTLASIAASIPGVPDISTGVADIVNLNGLASHDLVPGQVLEIPGY